MKTARKCGRVQAAVVVAVCLLPVLCHAQSPLASTAIQLFGVRLQVAAGVPTPIQMPINTAFQLSTSLTLGCADTSTNCTAVDGSSVFSQQPLVVRGRLSGPGIPTPIELAPVPLGQPLQVPPLTAAGPYEISGLCLTNDDRVSDRSYPSLLDATPSVLELSAVEHVFTSDVSARQLTMQEIEDLGVIIDPSSFSVYQFSFGVATTSNPVPITLDLLFSNDGEPQKDDSVGGTLAVPRLQTPDLGISGVLLQDEDGQSNQLAPIPAVVVIPGNIAFLHGFFDVQVLVANVTPPGSQLVITQAAATLDLPLGNNAVREFPMDVSPHDVQYCLAHCTDPTSCNACSDDPLWPAQTANPAPWDALCSPPEDRDPPIANPDLPCASLANTQAGIGGRVAGERAVPPGDQGVGDFTIEGRTVGTYRLHVTIYADLHLPTDPPETVHHLKGEAFGTVLVRDPNFSLTLNHPDVVRAGDTYSLFVTIRNISGTPASDVSLMLDPAQISGASLVSPAGGVATVSSIDAGDDATVEFQLIARQSGRVTAAAFDGGAGLLGTFVLRTGIGDDSIPLSPDTLVLSPYAQSVPADFLNTALRVLGLAYSVATTPPGQPFGIADRVPRFLVDTRGQELTEAGLRIRIGEAVPRSLLDLWLDWLGNRAKTADAPDEFDLGYDEVMRTTKAGHDLEQALVTQSAVCPNGESGCAITDVQAAFAASEVYRDGFISIAATGPTHLQIAEVSGDLTLVTIGSCATDTCATVRSETPHGLEREVPATSLISFNGAGGIGAGEWAIIGRAAYPPLEPNATPIARQFTVTVTGDSTSDIDIFVPRSGGGLRHFQAHGADVRASGLALQITDVVSGPGVSEVDPLLRDAAPNVVGVRQIPEADTLQRGHVVAVLFDKPIDPTSLAPSAFPLSYRAQQLSQPASGPTFYKVQRTRLQPRGRLALVQYVGSVSRFFHYNLTVRGVTDVDAHALAPQPGQTTAAGESGPWPVVGDFPRPVGGIVSGTVRDGNGNPLALAPVDLYEWFLGYLVPIPVEVLTGQTYTDKTGAYRFDFVGKTEPDLGPLRVHATDPNTGQSAERATELTFEGELRNIDLRMLGLGRVTGTVRNVDGGVPNATVTVESLVDGSARSVMTDALGHFTVNSVAVGDLQVAASATIGGATWHGAVSATLYEAGDTVTVNLLLFVETASVVGTVFDADGSTLVPVGAGVTVALFDQEAGPTFAWQQVTDGAGQFRFDNVPTDFGEVHVRAIRQSTGEQSTITVTVTPQATSVANIILPGTVTVIGQVLQFDGTPAVNVEVVGGTFLVRTDESGTFVIPRVGTGSQRFDAEDPATGAIGTVTVDLAPSNEPVRGVTITLAGAATIVGTVLNRGGTPQVGAVVSLIDHWGGRQAVTKTDGTGGFSFRNVGLAGKYTVSAIDGTGDGDAKTIAVLAPGLQPTLDLRYRGLGTITGIVIDGPHGPPSPDAVQMSYHRFNDKGAVEVFTEAVYSNHAVATTSCDVDCTGCTTRGDCATCPDGRFVFAHKALIGSAYQVLVASQFQTSNVVSGTVAADEDVVDQCLVLGQTGQLVAAVYLPDGRPAPTGVAVHFSDPFGGNLRDATTGPTSSDGHLAANEARFTLLPPGSFRVWARDPNTGNLGVAYGTLTVGQAAHVTIKLLGQGTVTVKVRALDASGAQVAVQNAQVTFTSGAPVAALLPAFPVQNTGATEDASVVYTGVPESDFSATALAEFVDGQRTGSVGGVITRDGDPETVTIIITNAATVKGTLYDAQPQPMAVPFAQVRWHPLQTMLGDMTLLDLYTTSDRAGAYVFPAVPLSIPFTLEFFDPGSGRIGMFKGPSSTVTPPDPCTIDGSSIIATTTDPCTIDLSFIPVGPVSGVVWDASGAATQGASVALRSSRLVNPAGLRSDASFFGPGTLTTTTNLQGQYQIGGVPQGAFTETATDPVTGATVAESAVMDIAADTTTPLPLDLTLDARGRVTGTVRAADGVTPVAQALVHLHSGISEWVVQTDADGHYSVPAADGPDPVFGVPRGPFSVLVQAQNGNDGGCTTGSISVDGETVAADLTFLGTGTITGTLKQESSGGAVVTVAGVTVTLTLPALACPLKSHYEIGTAPDGSFTFEDVPVGAFTLTARARRLRQHVRGRWERRVGA